MKKGPILIIEDDKNIREMYTDAFNAADLPSISAANGKEGIGLALKHHPSVILVDLMMPVLNGHEAVKKIRADAWGKDAKIIFLTNLTDPKDVFHAVEQNPEEYIVKSHTEISEVVNKVRTAMSA